MKIHDATAQFESPDALAATAAIRVSAQKTDQAVAIRKTAAKEFAALEIGFEPEVRKRLRRIYELKATLSVRPTVKGKTEIGPIHPYTV